MGMGKATRSQGRKHLTCEEPNDFEALRLLPTKCYLSSFSSLSAAVASTGTNENENQNKSETKKVFAFLFEQSISRKIT